MSETCKLYLITPPVIDDVAGFSSILAAALDAGEVACVQLRLKPPDGAVISDDDVLYAAEALGPIARARDVAFLINDRPDLALKAGADGVHIGQSDTPYRKARAILGDDAAIGVTCHHSRHLALEAGEAGADYVAFGAFFPTRTKHTEFIAEPQLLEWWRYATTTPAVAIGGVTPENCDVLVRAGVDFLAASAAVWARPDGPAAAVKAFEAAIGNA